MYHLDSGDSLMVNNASVSAHQTEYLSDGVVLLKAGFFTILIFDFGLKVMWDGGKLQDTSVLLYWFICII